jgi:cytochrome c peroxidase
MSRHGKLSLVLATALLACSEGTSDPVPIDLDADLLLLIQAAGVQSVRAPNPEPPELVALGRALFFDKILSGNRNIACATCHHPSEGTGDGLPLSWGEGGSGIGEARLQGSAEMIPRNAPHVFNAGLPDVTTMFWDSRLRVQPDGSLITPEPDLNGSNPVLADVVGVLRSALAAQAMFPVTSPAEMRGQPGENEIANLTSNAEIWAALVNRLVGNADDPAAGIEEYRHLFRTAFPGLDVPAEVTFGHAARAIAAFERDEWTRTATPFDAYLAGDRQALTDGQKRGALLFFGEAGCSMCHNGPLLTDNLHHALAVPQIGPGKNEPGDDRGRALVTGDPFDTYRFRTPTLRNVTLTGPWMHDGAFAMLEDAVRHVLDPATSLTTFDAEYLPTTFASTLDRDPGRNAARLGALDPMIDRVVDLTAAQVRDLIDFLEALTDPSAMNLMDVVPPRVPSGLPVN